MDALLEQRVLGRDLENRHGRMNTGDSSNRFTLLNCLRLPARLNAEEVGQLLGFPVHDVATLTKRGLLKPLGVNTKHTVKYYAAIEVEQKGRDRQWLDKASRVVSRAQGV